MYTIGKLAKDADLSISKIRYYISTGLLTPIDMANNGYMEFDESSLAILKQIKELREARQTIKEIQILFKKRGIL